MSRRKLLLTVALEVHEHFAVRAVSGKSLASTSITYPTKGDIAFAQPREDIRFVLLHLPNQGNIEKGFA
ncbi:hypothetical protein WAI453_005759 [Rhynchosporium graminicola]